MTRFFVEGSSFGSPALVSGPANDFRLDERGESCRKSLLGVRDWRDASDLRQGAPRANDLRPPEWGLGILEVSQGLGPVTLALEVRGSDKRLKALALSAWAAVAAASAALGPTAGVATGTAAASENFAVTVFDQEEAQRMSMQA